MLASFSFKTLQTCVRASKDYLLEQHLNEISKWEKNIANLSNEIVYLKEQIEWFKRQIFGQKTEKFVEPNQNAHQLLFEGFDKLVPVEDEKKHTVATHERTKRKPNGKDTITLPDDLPVERRVIDIPEAAKVCPETGKQLVKIGEEITSKLAHRPGSYFIKQIVRPKYALPQKSGEGILTADLPESLLNRCQADESLLADCHSIANLKLCLAKGSTSAAKFFLNGYCALDLL